MQITDLGSNARWTVREKWQQGAESVLVKKARRGGWTIAAFDVPADRLHHYLIDGWQVVEKP